MGGKKDDRWLEIWWLKRSHVAAVGVADARAGEEAEGICARRYILMARPPPLRFCWGPLPESGFFKHGSG